MHLLVMVMYHLLYIHLPVLFPGGSPTLEDLWVPPEEETLQLRQQALMSCLHCQIDPGLLLHTLPKHYIALCCLVNFFVCMGPESMMRECDVDAFVAQAVCLGLHTTNTIWRLRVSILIQGVWRAFDCRFCGVGVMQRHKSLVSCIQILKLELNDREIRYLWTGNRC